MFIDWFLIRVKSSF